MIVERGAGAGFELAALGPGQRHVVRKSHKGLAQEPVADGPVLGLRVEPLGELNEVLAAPRREDAGQDRLGGEDHTHRVGDLGPLLRRRCQRRVPAAAGQLDVVGLKRRLRGQ